VKAGGFLAGQEDIIDQLKPVEERYPCLDLVICATPLGTPRDVQLEDLDPFAKEVIPAFRDAKIAAAGAIDPRVSRLVPFGGTSGSPPGRITNNAIDRNIVRWAECRLRAGSGHPCAPGLEPPLRSRP
jgi:hypothetical protein